MRIATALTQVRQRIAAAAAESQRDPSEIRLVAVSKTQPAGAIREAYEAGQRDFGENYVQELLPKAQELGDLTELRWHLIGNLQRNKARHVVMLVSLVHTVDTIELARELARRFEGGRQTADQRLELLVEVSIAGEAQKHGASPAALGALLDAIDSLPSLSLRGLMCVPPLSEDAAAARPHFDALRQLRDQHGGVQRLPELSMGMTQDLEHAVAAGSTLVRVGTAIFGGRSP